MRERGREYVFRDWDDIQLLLSAMVPKASAAEAANYVILVLELDEDMVVASPIPLQRIPSNVPREECQGLQDRSMFLEVDISPEHIVDVKDGLGNSVKLQFERRIDEPAPMARLLAYVKPYWPYVAGATATTRHRPGVSQESANLNPGRSDVGARLHRRAPHPTSARTAAARPNFHRYCASLVDDRTCRPHRGFGSRPRCRGRQSPAIARLGWAIRFPL